jgi:hypothetical protein
VSPLYVAAVYPEDASTPYGLHMYFMFRTSAGAFAFVYPAA